jgi:ABC-type dipeptide/oligopeptide/nickel transport system permease subunit
VERFKLSWGAQPIPSWGIIISLQLYLLGKPYLAMVPGVAIIFAISFYDDENGDALDVKQ